jgi:hypothetical protein
MRFSRVFAEFTSLELPARVHEALIRSQLGDRLIGHIARDATEIEAREKPAPKAKPVTSGEAPAAPKKRGRPKKGEERPKEPTRIERQVAQTAEQSRAELPTACDVGSKKNSLRVQGDLDRLQAAHRHRRWRYSGQRHPDLRRGP